MTDATSPTTATPAGESPGRRTPDGTPLSRPEPTFEVPPGETPAGTCRHCDRPFRSEQALALHLGDVHPDALNDVEAAALERARELEDDELFSYHAKVVAALGALYSVTVIAYMVALGSGLL